MEQKEVKTSINILNILWELVKEDAPVGSVEVSYKSMLY